MELLLAGLGAEAVTVRAHGRAHARARDVGARRRRLHAMCLRPRLRVILHARQPRAGAVRTRRHARALRRVDATTPAPAGHRRQLPFRARGRRRRAGDLRLVAAGLGHALTGSTLRRLDLERRARGDQAVAGTARQRRRLGQPRARAAVVFELTIGVALALRLRHRRATSARARPARTRARSAGACARSAGARARSAGACGARSAGARCARSGCVRPAHAPARSTGAGLRRTGVVGGRASTGGGGRKREKHHGRQDKNASHPAMLPSIRAWRATSRSAREPVDRGRSRVVPSPDGSNRPRANGRSRGGCVRASDLRHQAPVLLVPRPHVPGVRARRLAVDVRETPHVQASRRVPDLRRRERAHAASSHQAARDHGDQPDHRRVRREHRREGRHHSPARPQVDVQRHVGSARRERSAHRPHVGGQRALAPSLPDHPRQVARRAGRGRGDEDRATLPHLHERVRRRSDDEPRPIRPALRSRLRAASADARATPRSPALRQRGASGGCG